MELEQNEALWVGKIEYFASNGASYIQGFCDKDEYVKAIADELYCNPTGFRYTTIAKDPMLMKRVDDEVCNIFCLENDRSLSYYEDLLRR